MLFDAFIPHEDNNFTPRVLQKTALFVMLFLIMTSFLAANMQAMLWQSSDWLVGAILPAVIVKETNKARQAQELPNLVRSDVLDQAAALKAAHMAEERYFAHNSPDGVTPWHWFNEVGYRYAYAGENLAVHFTDSEDVVDAWLQSPTHRANIVQGNYQEIGIGTARGRFEGFDTVFVVQLFGTPAAPAAVRATTSNDAFAARIAPTVNDVVATTQVSVVDTVPTIEIPVVAGDFSINEEVLSDSMPVYAAAEETTSNITTVPSESYVVSGGVIVTDVIATTSGLTPLEKPSAAVVQESNADTDPGMAALATQPNRILQSVYTILGFCLMIALITSVVWAWRQHSVRYVVQGVALLVLMSVLFYVHVMVTAGVSIL
jgi:uncharacterized protein YkwD